MAAQILNRTRRAHLKTLLTLFLVGATRLAHAQYTAHDLGTLGGTYSFAQGINNSVTIVGDAFTSGGADHAMSYSGGVMTDLGTLGGSTSEANAVNSSGTVVGGAYTSAGSWYHAFKYSGGVMTDLGTLGGSTSYANGLNNSGTIVGQAYTGGGINHAFSYSGGVMTDLGTLGGSTSFAFESTTAAPSWDKPTPAAVPPTRSVTVAE
jgi:probable HAF family extracellular repeat protein